VSGTGCATPTTCASSPPSLQAATTDHNKPGHGQEWAGELARLLVEIHHTIQAGKDNRAVALSPSLLATYQTRYDAIITAGHSQNPPTAGRRQSKAANLLARLDTQRADVLRFATDWTVPFDNNLAASPNATSAWSRSGRRSACRCGTRAERCPIAATADRYPALKAWEDEQVDRLRRGESHALPDGHPAVLDRRGAPSMTEG